MAVRLWDKLKGLVAASRVIAQGGWTKMRVDRRFKLVRYAALGCAVSAGYTLNVIAFVELLDWKSPALASAASFLIWTPISYVVHRDFTFRFDGGNMSSAVKFAAAFSARLAASAYTVYLAAIFGLPYLVGVLANWVVLPLISYFILDFWVFRPFEPPADCAPDSEAA
jgi:putative flippase GtrA